MKSLIQRLKRFSDDERGVSPVVGFVLMFALVMIVFTIYQSSVVPQQNKKVEFEQSQTIGGQMEQLDAAIISAPNSSSGSSQSVQLQLGVDYPTRTFAINPGNPVGSLAATGPHDVRISNGTNHIDLTTSFVNYDPNYNIYQQETQRSIEYGILFNDYPNPGKTKTLVQSEGNFLSSDGDTVNLDVISSDLSRQEMSTVVSTESVRTRHFEASSGPLTLTLKTEMSADSWEKILTDDNGNKREQIEDYTLPGQGAGGSTVKIVIKEGKTLNVKKLVAGNPADDVEIHETPQIANVTSKSPSVSNASNGNSTDLTVRTFDTFGALPGTDIDLTVTNGGGDLSSSSITSGRNGEATFSYNPASSDSGKTVEITASLPDQSGTGSSVTFTLDYPEKGGSDDKKYPSRDPINVAKGSLEPGPTDLIFRISPKNKAEIAGFSFKTKGNLEKLNETVAPHGFEIYTTKYQQGKSGSAGGLHYSSSEPIQFDNEEYTFPGGPLVVTSSEVQLTKFDQADNIEFKSITDSYEKADMIVYFILEDGSKRPVYITATMDGNG